jgi:hypothetical protein
VRVELERARLFVAPARPFPVTDGYTAWIQAGSLLHTVANQFSSVTTNPMLPAGGGRVVYFPGSTLGTQPVAYSGNYFRTTRNVPIRGGTASDFDGIFDRSIVPRDANLLGPNNGNTSNQEVIGVFVEQRVGRQLAFEAAFYRQGRNYLNRQPEAFNDNALYLMISTNDPVFDPVTGAQTGYGPAKNVGRYITRSNYQEAQDINAQGLEFELTANPIKNLRLSFNYSRTNSYGQDRPLNNVMAYLNQAKAVWLTPGNAARPTPNTTYGATIQENWNYIQQQYDTDTLTNGRMPFAFRPESANVFARYQFSAGALKGFAIGGGLNWRGPFVLGYRNNDSSQQVRGYEQIYINGMLSYECRLFGRVPATIQLNGDNLLGFDDRYPRRYYWFDDAQGSSRMYQYPYLVRRYSLTTTLRF